MHRFCKDFENEDDMATKVLIIESVKRPLKQLKDILKKKKFEVVVPDDTESIFSICTRDNITAVIVDEEAFGIRKDTLLKNLRENVLTVETKLFSWNPTEKLQYRTMRELKVA